MATLTSSVTSCSSEKQGGITFIVLYIIIITNQNIK